jgi:hypothetical protein
MLARTSQFVRVPLVAIAILAVLAFTAFTSMHTSASAPDPAVATTSPVIQTIAPDAQPCGGRYVTGDLVGDASPAAVYATMCGAR